MKNNKPQYDAKDAAVIVLVLIFVVILTAVAATFIGTLIYFMVGTLTYGTALLYGLNAYLVVQGVRFSLKAVVETIKESKEDE